MKKTFIILLLSIFLFNTIGYFIVFKVSQLSIKESMRENIGKGILNYSLSKLVISKASLSEINWLEEDEFIFKNNRYDVVNLVEDEQTFIFYCVLDEEETCLVSRMADHLKDNGAKDRSSKNTSLKTIDNSVKIVSDSFYELHPAITILCKTLMDYDHPHYNFDFLTVSFQPPERL
jgi:hypothetical protein